MSTCPGETHDIGLEQVAGQDPGFLMGSRKPDVHTATVVAAFDAVVHLLSSRPVRRRQLHPTGPTNAELLERAKRNPPPAAWYESDEEECPFVVDPNGE